MISRRKMFGFVAAAPVAAIGVGAAKAEANNAPTQAIMTLESGNSNYRMLLTGNSHTEPVKHQVSFAIGQDGHLWINTNSEWKRVATDG